MISGFLLVHKPAGPTSAGVVGWVRRLLDLRRVGHSGTLDPGADGLLVLGLNRATSLLPYLPSHKTYRAEGMLGVTTDSLDAQGRVTCTRPVPALTHTDLAYTLQRFAGDILQVPPQVSALKHCGQRLYDLARAGRTVEIAPRPVTVFSLRLLEFSSPRVTFEVTCSGGTYVRVLAADLGEALGCGAHLAHLTRTVCNGFGLEQAATLEQLTAEASAGRWCARVLSPAAGLAHLPAVTASAAQAAAVLHGRALPLSLNEPEFSQPVRILNDAGELLAVARRQGRSLVMERVLPAPAEEAACA
jgi:tRNA pseudouridine55 synthase